MCQDNKGSVVYVEGSLDIILYVFDRTPLIKIEAWGWDGAQLESAFRVQTPGCCFSALPPHTHRKKLFDLLKC